MKDIDNFLWSERYRPACIDDCILPNRIKSIFKEFISKGELPHLLLHGPAGCGKTSVAKAAMKELDADFLFVNGSMNGGIDTLRNDIQTYASTVSFSGTRKYVLCDEADFLNANTFQPAARGFLDEFSRNVSFIFTCNYPARIIEPLHSRCCDIDFNFSREEKAELAASLFKRLQFILNEEGITYEKKVVAELVKKHFPDARRIINELQRYSSSGQIDSGVLATLNDTTISLLIEAMKKKDLNGIIKWVHESSDIETADLFRNFYDHATKYFKTSSIPLMIVTLAKYQYQEAFVADKVINTTACMLEISADADFL